MRLDDFSGSEVWQLEIRRGTIGARFQLQRLGMYETFSLLAHSMHAETEHSGAKFFSPLKLTFVVDRDVRG